MKRWVLKSGTTTLEGLILEDAVKPEPGPGEVRVRIRAVSLNYREQLILGNAGGNWRMDRDLIPIADGAGDIDAIGEGVEQWTPGDKVITVYLRDFIHWPPHAGIGLGLVGLFNFGDVIEPGLFLAKGVSVHGIPVGSRDGLEEVVDFVDKHQIKPVIDRVVPFGDAKQAYQAQSAPDLLGKIVIEIA